MDDQPWESVSPTVSATTVLSVASSDTPHRRQSAESGHPVDLPFDGDQGWDLPGIPLDELASPDGLAYDQVEVKAVSGNDTFLRPATSSLHHKIGAIESRLAVLDLIYDRQGQTQEALAHLATQLQKDKTATILSPSGDTCSRASRSANSPDTASGECRHSGVLKAPWSPGANGHKNKSGTGLNTVTPAAPQISAPPGRGTSGGIAIEPRTLLYKSIELEVLVKFQEARLKEFERRLDKIKTKFSVDPTPFKRCKQCQFKPIGCSYCGPRERARKRYHRELAQELMEIINKG